MNPSAVTKRDVIPAADLAMLLDNPLDLYVKRTLGIDVFEGDGDADPVLPTEGERRDYADAVSELLAVLRTDPDNPEVIPTAAPAWRQRVANRGVLPPLSLAEETLNSGQQLAMELQRWGHLHEVPFSIGEQVDVRIPLSDGRTVVGAINGVQPDGQYRLARIFTERNTDYLAPQLIIDTLLLALHFLDPGLRAASLGQNPKERNKTETRKAAIAEGTTIATLQATLESLVSLYDEALVVPRPTFGDTGKLLASTGDSDDEARQEFKEFCDRLLMDFRSEVRLFGPAPEFEQVFSDAGVIRFLTRWAPLTSNPITVDSEARSTKKWPRPTKAPSKRAAK